MRLSTVIVAMVLAAVLAGCSRQAADKGTGSAAKSSTDKAEADKANKEQADAAQEKADKEWLTAKVKEAEDKEKADRQKTGTEKGKSDDNAKPADGKPNPAGTWKLALKYPAHVEEMTLKLKLEGNTLSGSATGRDGTENAIKDATYKDGDVSFGVVEDRQGKTSTTTYEGKVKGDTITGTTQFGQDWTAKRVNTTK